MYSKPVLRLVTVLLFAATHAGLASAATLADAAESGAWSRVDELLSSQAQIDESQADGTTALIWAAYHRNTDLVSELLSRGADANATNRYGISPLLQAATVGDAATIAALLEHGADANAAAPEGDTALMLASRTGNTDAVRLLLDAGAAVDTRESWHGENAVIWAAGENHADIVALLLEHGAEIDATTTEFTWDLTQTGVSSQLPRGGITALVNAARENSLEAARVLIDHGANVNALDPDGISVLRVAIANDNLDMAMMLLESGADPHDGAFADAIKYRSFPVVRAERNRIDQTTSLDLVAALLAAGVDVTAAAEQPMTRQLWAEGMAHPNEPPLYMAAHGGDVEMMRLLGEYGADAATTFSSKGETVLMAALGLTPHPFGGGGTKPPQATEVSIALGTLALELGSSITAARDHDETVLHMAAERGRADLIPFLLEHGAPLAAKDVRNRTALDAAEGRPPVPRVVGMAPDTIVTPEAAEMLREAMAAANIAVVPWVDMDEPIEDYVSRFKEAREAAEEASSDE